MQSYVKRYKFSRCLGKIGHHLGFSNTHLFGFEECFKTLFCPNYHTFDAIVNLGDLYELKNYLKT